MRICVYSKSVDNPKSMNRLGRATFNNFMYVVMKNCQEKRLLLTSKFYSFSNK